jgi:hypothetical protein
MIKNKENMIFTEKEQQLLAGEYTSEQINAMSDAIDRCDIIFHKISDKTGAPRLITPEAARKCMGTELFCQGIAHAYLYGRRGLINHDTGAKVMFINVLTPASVKK